MPDAGRNKNCCKHYYGGAMKWKQECSISVYILMLHTIASS